jgi:hypothetical protein
MLAGKLQSAGFDKGVEPFYRRPLVGEGTDMQDLRSFAFVECGELHFGKRCQVFLSSQL